MDYLIEQINRYFEGRLVLNIVGNRLEITVDTQTMYIDLPTVSGTKAKAR
jgi:hypothetical protein